MARSKHTRPDHLLAADRVRAPYQPRGSDDTTSRYGVARLLKECGVVLAPGAEVGGGASSADAEPAPLPRLRVHRPRPGHVHPATRADIEALLRLLGERCYYGLRSIELLRGPTAPTGTKLQIARLIVPGRIVLYDQPAPPWLLPGRLAQRDEERLRRAGAEIELAGGGAHAIISWSEQALRDFVLFDGLMHEVGHHLIQQYKGKRTARLARTRDHEAFADHFARQCRLLYGEARRE